MPKKKTVQSSITSMGFPLLQKPGEMCVDRQIGVSGKFWNFNRGRMREEETTTVFKCTVRVFHVLLFFELDTVSDEIRRWSSLSEGKCQCFVSTEDGILNEFEMMCQLRILFPLHFVVFKQTECHLTAETNVEQVFSQVGQLSEVNLDPDALVDMVSIMVNKLESNPLSKISWTSTIRCSVTRTRLTKKTFSTVPTSPTTRTRTRT